MKNKNLKRKLSLSDIIGTIVVIIVFSSSIYLIYGAIDSFKNEDSSISTNKVWCANCQTYHDKEIAEKEAKKLVWCSNCNKYHAPGEE